MSRWYVVNTLPNQEQRADLNLKRQGFQSWLPSIKRVRRHARRVDTIRAPLFPSYLLVKLDVDRQPWVSINGTFGVRRLLCLNERPIPLPSAFVDTLAAAADEEGLIAGFGPSLKVGEKVRILAGPFADCVATLVNFASRDRIAILLDVLGREVTTVVSRQIVIPAS